VSALGASFSEGFKKEFLCVQEGGDYWDLTGFLCSLAVDICCVVVIIINFKQEIKKGD
jgi:hypothetical protein